MMPTWNRKKCYLHCYKKANYHCDICDVDLCVDCYFKHDATHKARILFDEPTRTVTLPGQKSKASFNEVVRTKPFLFLLSVNLWALELADISTNTVYQVKLKSSSVTYQRYSAVIVDKKIYITGGYRRKHTLDQLLCLNLLEDYSHMIELRPMPYPKAGHTCLQLGEKMLYTLGGEGYAQGGRVIDPRSARYEIAANRWNIIPALPLLYSPRTAVFNTFSDRYIVGLVTLESSAPEPNLRINWLSFGMHRPTQAAVDTQLTLVQFDAFDEEQGWSSTVLRANLPPLCLPVLCQYSPSDCLLIAGLSCFLLTFYPTRISPTRELDAECRDLPQGIQIQFGVLAGFSNNRNSVYNYIDLKRWQSKQGQLTSQTFVALYKAPSTSKSQKKKKS